MNSTEKAFVCLCLCISPCICHCICLFYHYDDFQNISPKLPQDHDLLVASGEKVMQGSGRGRGGAICLKYQVSLQLGKTKSLVSGKLYRGLATVCDFTKHLSLFPLKYVY